jgi:hypothetical protein
MISVNRRLHGFGVKLTALGNKVVRDLLWSTDSMAWSFAARRQDRNQNDWREARAFAEKVSTFLRSTVSRSLISKEAGLFVQRGGMGIRGQGGESRIVNGRTRIGAVQRYATSLQPSHYAKDSNGSSSRTAFRYASFNPFTPNNHSSRTPDARAIRRLRRKVSGEMN